ncbi:hypothetical protein LIER_43812 [Lithospermum erythrorhizon]|uniref:Uncharacterized protein n=1 Tax=Lithospermum erythrorhizon TaxID=34254 RepID=A0AAV3QYQ4_LITER
MVIMWNKEKDVQIENFSDWYIGVHFNENGKRKWLCMFIYANCDDSLRKAQFEVFRILIPDDDSGWCLMGNFNDILSKEEKEGWILDSLGSPLLGAIVVREDMWFDSDWIKCWVMLHGVSNSRRLRVTI